MSDPLVSQLREIARAILRSEELPYGLSDIQVDLAADALESAAVREQRLRAALERAKVIADEAAGAWDSDQDMRVGKILYALAGRSPGYRADIDEIHAALAEASPETPGAPQEPTP